jgi:hypothetical protein
MLVVAEMTPSQADFLWELAERDGSERELEELFPEVDWVEVERVRKQAQEEHWAQRRNEPRGGGITLDQVSEVMKAVMLESIERSLNQNALWLKLSERDER